MTTSQDILQAVAAASVANVTKGVYQIRQHGSEVTMMSAAQLAAMLKTLADEEVRAAIDESNGSTITKFRPLC